MSKIKTVYIATFYQYNNYGTRLQNYALCQVLREYGLTVKTLSPYSSIDTIKDIVKNVIAIIPLNTKKHRIYQAELSKQKVFGEFNKKLNLTKIRRNALSTIDFKEACGIAGSDQIWSPTHLKNNPKDKELFFLSFLPESQRYSYAPSFGVSSVPADMANEYQQALTRFVNLSTREQVGQNIIHQITGLSAVIMPDPTFLLSRTEWQTVYPHDKSPCTSKKYVLKYFLSEHNKTLHDSIQTFASSIYIDVISVAGNHISKDDYLVSPDEFVALIRNATYVFTDSFHAAVFSIIFNIPFIVFQRIDVKQISRIKTLLDTYALPQSLITDDNSQYESIFQSEDFSSANKIMLEERERGREYIKTILGI
ncbi:polysaccharide pyruvyl transferase family protein [Bifidobacterium phasiani]|uniref:Polysaccharide pyruvyl transferase family protein n=1 Tax=Bifidobacterium phasiani TaxID=2834431 RepID=A0ABS6W807_9BIFI|nr:polysaccharide pyruvyl transferase family protein [Bifidobacterium phasiani]MBW3082605.1 polysaccharide pyruvyl transferase family protein [Bifidobacterium phasiani]